MKNALQYNALREVAENPNKKFLPSTFLPKTPPNNFRLQTEMLIMDDHHTAGQFSVHSGLTARIVFSHAQQNDAGFSIGDLLQLCQYPCVILMCSHSNPATGQPKSTSMKLMGGST